MIRLVLPLVGLGCHSLCAGPEIENGDFSGGLAGWQASGVVTASTGQAVLAEPVTGRTLLYQSVSLSGGGYTLSFDFRGLLASTEPVGFSLDSFFASLYFGAVGEVFAPEAGTGFSSAIGLLDLDVKGARPLAGAVAALAGEFSQYTIDFELTEPAVATVVFELANLNGSFGDSSVLIDNVTLVPEPALGGLLLALSAVGWLWVRRRRKGV